MRVSRQCGLDGTYAGGAWLHHVQERTGLVRKNLHWVEAIMGLITGALFLLTLVQADWLEAIGINPDGGNGSVERMIVAALALATVALFSLASYQFGKAKAATA